MITEPLLSKETLDKILAVTNDIIWRMPRDRFGGYERTCTSFPISMASVGNYPLAKERLEQVKWADDTLMEVTRKALKIYKDKIPNVFTKTDSGFDILRYEVGQKISYHVDDGDVRTLTMSIALNDDYTGGEFRFWKDESAIYRLPLGAAIVFPPNFMYGHEILPVTSGVRYSMVTWIS